MFLVVRCVRPPIPNSTLPTGTGLWLIAPKPFFGTTIKREVAGTTGTADVDTVTVIVRVVIRLPLRLKTIDEPRS